MTPTPETARPSGPPSASPPSGLNIGNVFTVDVEDYFHVQAFADRVRPDEWEHYESRVADNTRRLLRMLDEFRVPATFFVLGWVAERFPALIRDIQKSGHEIGCHSYWHRMVYRQTPAEFRTDLQRATNVLEEVTGEVVRAYRAPSFSITQKSLWALDVLIEEGYESDSSIFPVRHDTYGIPAARREPHRIERRPAGRIYEFPPAVRRKWKMNIPVAGGGYFRMLPLRLTLHWLRNINRKEGRPFVFYIHPWELDPEQPRLPAAGRSRLRHYQNLRTTETKLRRLLESFQFVPLRELVPPPESDPTAGSQSILDDTAVSLNTTEVLTVEKTGSKQDA